WLGKCLSCGEWNTYVEEVVEKQDQGGYSWKQGKSKDKTAARAIPLDQVRAESERRIDTGDKELNRTLGGGITPGSLVLIGGEPGIGKSTLMLQLALKLKDLKLLYISGEESEHQIKSRADRLSGNTGNCYILAETS